MSLGGFKPIIYSYLDESNTERPNIVVRYGDKERTLWVVSHIDTVSKGDISINASLLIIRLPLIADIYDEKTADRGYGLHGRSEICEESREGI